MMRKIRLVDYEVDEAMLGSEWDSEKYSLEGFCEILQKLCEEKCLFFEIIPITDSWNGASIGNYEDADYSLWSHKHLGGHFWDFDNCWDNIPWSEAIDRYFEEFDRELLNQISDDDLTEIPEKLRDAIQIKRDSPEKFTREMYQNVYHNLSRKDPEKFEKLSKKFSQKSKLSRIFQQIEF